MLTHMTHRPLGQQWAAPRRKAREESIRTYFPSSLSLGTRWKRMGPVPGRPRRAPPSGATMRPAGQAT
eukprot:1842196-Pyramimonas_sp.AAC.1